MSNTFATLPVMAGDDVPAGPVDPIFNRLLKDRIIWMGEEVKDDMANRICAQLLMLAAEDPKKDIWLYINSPGGSITAGMAIYDTMQLIEPDVATVGLGMCASMGQFLLSSGTKGKRYLTSHARVLMHQPSGGIGGTATDVRINAELIMDMKKTMRPLVHRPGSPRLWLRGQARDHAGHHRQQPAGGVRLMASEEAKFAARADRLAGRQGVAGFMPASARAAQPAPTNRYIMPQFVEKTPYGMKTQDAYSRLFEDRIIFLGVQVDDASADDVMAQLLVLESQDPNRDVMMYINSPGGSMTAMTAIYDTMQYIKPDVQTVCLGQAASAAAILLASGTKGKRLMLPNARVLIHQPAIDQGFGKATEIEIQAKEMLRMREWLEETLAKHTGQDVEKIRRDIEVDTFLTAPEAKEYGIVDEVLEHRQ